MALENYLEHLQNLERENPKLLLAYVYHLYLGLLSGGQILAKKRSVFGDGTYLYLTIIWYLKWEIGIGWCIIFSDYTLGSFTSKVMETPAAMHCESPSPPGWTICVDYGGQIFIWNKIKKKGKFVFFFYLNLNRYKKETKTYFFDERQNLVWLFTIFRYKNKDIV